MNNDEEFTRLAVNVAEIALEKHDAWKAYAHLTDRRYNGECGDHFELEREAALSTASLWEERYTTAVNVLWHYREQRKKVRS